MAKKTNSGTAEPNADTSKFKLKEWTPLALQIIIVSATILFSTGKFVGSFIDTQTEVKTVNGKLDEVTKSLNDVIKSVNNIQNRIDTLSISNRDAHARLQDEIDGIKSKK